MLVGVVVVAVAGVAVWQQLIRDEEGTDTALAGATETANEEESGLFDGGETTTGTEEESAEEGFGSEVGDSGTEAETDSSSVGEDTIGESTDRTADGYPPATKREMAQEIEVLLRDVHTAIVNRRFNAAWELLTERKQRKFEQEDGYGAWKQAQASLSSYLEPSGLQVRIDKLVGDGVARVDVSGMGWTQPGASCSEWSGLTWARYENGSWRYDPGYSTTPDRERRWEDRYDELLGAGC